MHPLEIITCCVFVVLGLGNAYFSWLCHQSTRAAEAAQAKAEERARKYAGELTAAKLELHSLRALHQQWVEDGRGPPH